MKKLLVLATASVTLFACGPSEEELKKQAQEEIEKSKTEIDGQFDLIMEEYYLADEDFDKSPAISKIKKHLSSKHEEVKEYAQKHIDSIPKLKTELHDLIYGELLDYAKQQGWDKMSKEEFKKIENSLLVKGDEFSSGEVYRHPSSPKFINQNGFFMFYKKLYSDDKEPLIGLKAQYYDDDWLFVKQAAVSLDGDVYTLDFEKWDRDNSGGMIYEWSVMPKPSYNLIVKIIKSKNAKVRYTGDNYYDDRTISSSQKAALKSVLQAYYGLYLKDKI